MKLFQKFSWCLALTLNPPTWFNQRAQCDTWVWWTQFITICIKVLRAIHIVGCGVNFHACSSKSYGNFVVCLYAIARVVNINNFEFVASSFICFFIMMHAWRVQYLDEHAFSLGHFSDRIHFLIYKTAAIYTHLKCVIRIKLVL